MGNIVYIYIIYANVFDICFLCFFVCMGGCIMYVGVYVWECVCTIAEKYKPDPGVEPKVPRLTYERSNQLNYSSEHTIL